MARSPISGEPRDGLVLRFVDPRLAEILEALPRFGQLTIHMVDGRVQKHYDTSLRRLVLDGKERHTDG